MNFLMTNAELRAAIDQCAANITAVSAASPSARVELELHLEALLEVERQRAAIVESLLPEKDPQDPNN